MKALGVLLVGYGFAGQTFHAPVIAAVEGLKLVGAVSSQPQKVQTDWPEVWVEGSLEAALKRPEVELVVVASPNQTHFEQAYAALQAGKHVVVDKPFTLSLAEAQTLAALAQAQQRVLTVYQNRRYDADFLTLQTLLQGEVGEPVYFESRFDRFRPQVRQRWREQDLPGSGLWYDLGPHLADQALLLFGPPLAVYADLAQQRSEAQAVDYFHVVLRYARLRAVLHASSLAAGGSPRFWLHTTQGSYLKHGLDTQEEALKQGLRPGSANWGQDPVMGQWWEPEGQPQNLPNQPGDYRRFYQGVLQAIRSAGPPPVTLEQALQLMRLLELGVQSATERRELAWSE